MEYRQPEREINLKEYIWDLLGQWKAVLIVALVVMVLFTCVKYHKDLNAYNEAIHEKEDTALTEEIVEDKISDIIATLPEDEVNTVEFMVNQNAWVETEKEYINKSILMNTNPANQRTLLLDYYLSMSDVTESKMTALIYGYASYLSDEELINSVGKEIAPDSDRKYIAELISFNSDNSGKQSGNYNLSTDSESDGAVLEIRIVLPNEVDATKVEAAMTSALTSYSSEIKNKIGNHSISLINYSEAYLFNSVAVNNHNSIMSSIYNFQSNANNMLSTLSDEQKTALESIMTLKKEQQMGMGGEEQKDDVNASKEGFEELSKPSLSKRYALLGFILGALIYAFFYLLYIVVGNRIRCARDSENCTKSRLLGEVYYKRRYNGVRALLHSRFVDKYRYKGYMNEGLQIEKMACSLEAECEHNGVKVLSVFTHNDSSELVSRIYSLFNNSEIKLEVFKVQDSINERDLVGKDNAVFLVRKNDKLSELNQLVSVCDEYNITELGNIFIGEYAG